MTDTVLLKNVVCVCVYTDECVYFNEKLALN